MKLSNIGRILLFKSLALSFKIYMEGFWDVAKICLYWPMSYMWSVSVDCLQQFSSEVIRQPLWTNLDVGQNVAIGLNSGKNVLFIWP